jgi:hypothetical protein
MGLGLGELVIVLIVGCFFLFPFISSIVGIQRALRRQRQGARSVGAVVWASVALAFACPGLISPLFGLANLALTITWLVYAVQTNRKAARLAATAAAAPPVA